MVDINITHSHLRCFEQCKLLFRKRYIGKIKEILLLRERELKRKFSIGDGEYSKLQEWYDKLDEAEVETYTYDMLAGEAFHITLRWAYEEMNPSIKISSPWIFGDYKGIAKSERPKSSNNNITLDGLWDFYSERWKHIKKNTKIKISTTKPYKDENYFQIAGRIWIKDYYNRYYPFNQGTVISVENSGLVLNRYEEYFKLNAPIHLDFGSIDKNSYRLSGDIDRMELKGNRLKIVDYKTETSGLHWINWLLKIKKPIDRQVYIYKLLVQHNKEKIFQKMLNLDFDFIDIEYYYTKWKTDVKVSHHGKSSNRMLRRWYSERESKIFQSICDIIKHIEVEITKILLEGNIESAWLGCGSSECGACTSKPTPNSELTL